MERRPFVLDASAACLDGHFPGRPVIPGVALLDAALSAFNVPSPLRIDQAKFLRPCLPGMTLELVMAARRPGGADVRIECAGELMASVRLSWREAPDVDGPGSHG